MILKEIFHFRLINLLKNNHKLITNQLLDNFMTWSLYFKTIAIIYPIYYAVNIIYDLTVYYRRKKKEEKGVHEYDTSHLNSSLSLDIKPIKVSDIIGQHTPIVPTANSARSTSLRLEDIDNSKNVIESMETIEDFYNESFKEFSELAKRIYKNEEI